MINNYSHMISSAPDGYSLPLFHSNSKDNKSQKLHNFFINAVKLQTELCEGKGKKKTRKAKHTKSKNGHKVTKVFKKHAKKTDKKHKSSKSKKGHKTKKPSHKKKAKPSKHVSKQHVSHKNHAKSPAVPVIPQNVPQAPLPYEDSMQALQAHYRELVPFLPASQRAVFEGSVSSNSSLDTVRTQCVGMLRQTITTRINSFQEAHEPLYPVVKGTFPNYPELLAFVLEADTVVQTAKKLMNESLGVDAHHYVMQSMQELGAGLCTIDQFTETSTRFGKLLFLYEHHQAQFATLPWSNPRTSSQAIDQATQAVFSAQIHSFTTPTHASKAAALYKERQFALFLAKALVRPSGEINQALIPALKDKLQEYKSKLGSLPYVHMSNVLFQIAKDERVVAALRNTQAPCALFQPVVRNAAARRVEGAVDRTESMIAIISALFTPWGQQDNFGSCQTTAPLAIIRNNSLETAICDLQEIIRSGKILRSVLGRETSYLALPQSYAILNECAPSDRHHVASNLIHPLLSAWENCLAGMHSGMKDADYVNNIGKGVRSPLWGSSCYRIMQLIANQLRIKHSPFSPKTSPSDPRLNPLKQLRFAFTPPHKAYDTNWHAQLYFENEQHEWQQINDQKTLQNRLAEIFRKITHKKLSAPLAKILRQSIQTAFGSAGLHFSTTPQIFYDRSDSGMGAIYFSQNSQLKDVTFSNVRDAAQQFRQFACEQKNVYRNVKNIKLLAQGEFVRTSVGHAFQVQIHSTFLSDQEKNSQQWIADKEAVLRSVMVSQVPQLVDELISWSSKLYFASSAKRQAFVSHMQSKSLLSFCDWSKELAVSLKRFGSVSDHELEALKPTIVNFMNVYNPSIYAQLVLPFANNNYVSLNEKEQSLAPHYYCFACVPSLSGAPSWKVMEISKRRDALKNRMVREVPLKDMKILMPNGKVFDHYKTREHNLRQERHSLALERHLKAFCTAWNDVAREGAVANNSSSRARKRLERAHRNYHAQIAEGQKMQLCFTPEMVLAREGTYPREALQALLAP